MAAHHGAPVPWLTPCSDCSLCIVWVRHSPHTPQMHTWVKTQSLQYPVWKHGETSEPPDHTHDLTIRQTYYFLKTGAAAHPPPHRLYKRSGRSHRDVTCWFVDSHFEVCHALKLTGSWSVMWCSQVDTSNFKPAHLWLFNFNLWSVEVSCCKTFLESKNLF